LRESAPVAQVTTHSITHNIVLGYCTQLLVINPRELQTGWSWQGLLPRSVSWLHGQ